MRDGLNLIMSTVFCDLIKQIVFKLPNNFKAQVWTDQSNLDLSPVLPSSVSPSPCVVSPVSTLILKAAAPDEEDQSRPGAECRSPAPSSWSLCTVILLISLRSIPPAAPIHCAKQARRKKKKVEKILPSYVRRGEDFSQGVEHKSYKDVSEKFSPKFVCCVRRMAVLIWQCELFWKMSEMNALS